MSVQARPVTSASAAFRRGAHLSRPAPIQEGGRGI